MGENGESSRGKMGENGGKWVKMGENGGKWGGNGEEMGRKWGERGPVAPPKFPYFPPFPPIFPHFPPIFPHFSPFSPIFPHFSLPWVYCGYVCGYSTHHRSRVLLSPAHPPPGGPSFLKPLGPPVLSPQVQQRVAAVGQRIVEENGVVQGADAFENKLPLKDGKWICEVWQTQKWYVTTGWTNKVPSDAYPYTDETGLCCVCVPWRGLCLWIRGTLQCLQLICPLPFSGSAPVPTLRTPPHQVLCLPRSRSCHFFGRTLELGPLSSAGACPRVWPQRVKWLLLVVGWLCQNACPWVP